MQISSIHSFVPSSPTPAVRAGSLTVKSDMGLYEVALDSVTFRELQVLRFRASYPADDWFPSGKAYIDRAGAKPHATSSEARSWVGSVSIGNSG